MKTDPVSGTTFACPYCGKDMMEDWSHIDDYKCVMLYCNDCRYGVFGDDPKDAYAFLMRKDDKE